MKDFGLWAINVGFDGRVIFFTYVKQHIMLNVQSFEVYFCGFPKKSQKIRLALSKENHVAACEWLRQKQKLLDYN